MNEIFTRRSVRQFSTQVVEAEKVDKLVRAGMQAPSAGNQQPWEFIVISGKDNLVKLSKSNPYAGSLCEANLGILVLGNRQRMKMPQYWEQDLAAATQNIQLQATALGLGSVWYGTAPETDRMKFISKLYDLDEHLYPFSILGIGYPANENANHFVDRFDASRVRYISE